MLYGAVFAAVGGVQLDHAIHAAGVGLNSERQGELLASMDVVDAHGPPLTGSSNGYYPVATDDDRGSFIYIPLAGNLFHTHDLDAILKWFFIVFFVPLLLAYPLVLYELTGSFVAAIAAPQILLAHSSFLRTSGIFWLPAWANLVLLPLLLLIAKRWDRSRLWLLVAGALVASLLSSMRANAGLGFLIGAVVLLFMRMPSWRMRCWSVGLVLLAYLSIGTFAMHAVQVQRDDVVGHDFTSPYPNGHPFWHNAYIGLGYLKNPYGLYPSDAAAMAAAQRHDPGATFPTKRYERALRAVYFDIVKRHPGFVLHEYALKAVVVLGRAVDWFRAAVVLVPLLLLFGKRRHVRRSQVGLLLGAGLVAVITPIVTTPTEITETESGWYGLLLLLWLLAIGWLARPVEAVVVRLASRLVRRWLAAREQAVLRREAVWPLKLRVVLMARNLGRHVVAGPARAFRAAFRAGRRAWAVPGLGGVVRSIAAAAVVAAMFIGSGSAKSTDASAAYWGNQGLLVPRAAVAGTTIVGWTFGRGVPPGWRATAHSLRSTGTALLLRTTRGKYGHQLSSPTRTLEPGSYFFLVDGRVMEGGLQLAVLDDRAGGTVGLSFYWWGEPYARNSRMAVAFELAKPTQVSFILANFSLLEHRSLWSIRSATVIRQPGGCRLGSPYAWFTNAPAPSS